MLFPSSLICLSLLAAVSSALPVPQRREVPQEHSHEDILIALRTQLAINNPESLGDPVFGLLGAAAAAGGLGTFTGGADCLQAATADVAFTNAKAAGDVVGMTTALQYRTLERNTGAVGLASVLCTAFTPVNAEVAALAQHQDPASDGAAASNKALVLELAKQINSIGGDPQEALATGTFAPGTVGDPTAAGNTCDDIDPLGCINTKNLIVFDATAEEIVAAVGGIEAAAATTAAAAVATTVTTEVAAATATTCPAQVTVTVTAEAAAATTVAAAVTTAAAAAATTAVTAAVTTASAATVTAVASTDSVISTSTATFGTCTNAGVEFAAGLNGRKATEFTFQPANLVDFNHGEALNPQIIFEFICDTFVNKCGGTTDNVATCKTFAATLTTRDATTATAWNTGIEALAFAVGGAVSTVDASGAVVAPVAAAVADPIISTSTATFGTCTNAGVEFAAGLNGRKATEFTFQPANLADFNHGEALNPQIIFEFICDTFVNRCGGSTDNVATCKTFAATISTRDAAAANAWNTGIEALAF